MGADSPGRRERNREVYPAATLVSHGFRSDGYKKRKQTVERSEILRSLQAVVSLPSDRSSMEGSADALDAVLCSLRPATS